MKLFLKTSFQVSKLIFICFSFIFIAQTFFQKHFLVYPVRMFSWHAIQYSGILE